ncbi:MAG: 3-isopropylmalate dehydratase small subunit [bacterium]|nr:3-isopropylmalate dehydratase small subunit [bacterium]
MKPFTRLSSRIAPLPLANVDTDQIIPAAYLKVTDKSGLGRGLFANWRYRPDGEPDADFVLNQPRHHGAEILLAGENFGCGSSREHAPWALLDYGFRAVISPRFADIFRSNALKNGLLAASVPHAAHQALMRTVEADPEVTITIDLGERRIILPGGDAVAFSIDAFARHCLLHGVDQLGYLLEQLPRIEAHEAEHPPRVDTRSGSPATPHLSPSGGTR